MNSYNIWLCLFYQLYNCITITSLIYTNSFLFDCEVSKSAYSVQARYPILKPTSFEQRGYSFLLEESTGGFDMGLNSSLTGIHQSWVTQCTRPPCYKFCYITLLYLSNRSGSLLSLITYLSLFFIVSAFNGPWNIQVVNGEDQKWCKDLKECLLHGLLLMLFCF